MSSWVRVDLGREELGEPLPCTKWLPKLFAARWVGSEFLDEHLVVFQRNLLQFLPVQCPGVDGRICS